MRQKNVCIVIIKDYTSLYNVDKLTTKTRKIVSIQTSNGKNGFVK